jgi:hypothetical protein
LEKETDIEALKQLCRELEGLGELERDLEHVMDLGTVVKDTAFQDYLLEENSKLAERQILALRTVLQGVTDDKFPTYQKPEIAARCHVQWKVTTQQLLDEVLPAEPVQSFAAPPVYTPHARHYVPPVPRKRPRSPDVRDCQAILSRHIKPGSQLTKLPTSARRLPEQIAVERTTDLASFLKDIETNNAKTVLGRVLNPRSRRPPKKTE